MAEETPTDTTVQDAPVIDVPAGQAPETPAKGPHPLEPGGPRFEEVYARMKEAERRDAEKAERLARLEGQMAAQQRPAQPQPQFYTPEVLQAAVDRGQITPAQMAQQIAWQQTQIATAQYAQQSAIQQKVQESLKEVRQYMDKIPELKNASSAEIARVAEAAQDIAGEMNLPIDDARVQRLALRATFGTLDRVTRAQQTREADRRSRVPHAEAATNGSGSQEPTTPAQDAWKQGIPQAQIDYWTRLRYTPERMKEEAKFYRRRG